MIKVILTDKICLLSVDAYAAYILIIDIDIF